MIRFRNAARALLLGVAENLLGRALLVHDAAVEEADLASPPRARSPSRGWRAAWSCPRAARSRTMLRTSDDEFGIERRGDLVEQQEHRVHGKRADDGDALLLAARQPVGIFLGLVLEADAGEQRHRPLLRFGRRQAQDPDRRQRDVLQHGHVREQLKLWNTMPTSRRSALRSTPGPADAVALQADLAALDRLQAVDAAQQRRLAAARGADQADDLMLLDVEVDALAALRTRRSAC